MQDGANPVEIVNNIFAGPGTVLKGPGTLSHNLQSPNPGLVNPSAFDYHLKAGSAPIDAGVDPGMANGFSLTPSEQYVHKADKEPRPLVGPIDIGAYEFQPAATGR